MNSDVTLADETSKEAYKHWASVTLRFGDTDTLGHINNAVFVTLLESGRVEALFGSKQDVEDEAGTWVIVGLTINFRSEMHYPGTAHVGTALIGFGNSSVKFRQAIFKDDVCCATSESTIVMINKETRKPMTIPAETRDRVQRRLRAGQ